MQLVDLSDTTQATPTLHAPQSSTPHPFKRMRMVKLCITNMVIPPLTTIAHQAILLQIQEWADLSDTTHQASKSSLVLQNTWVTAMAWQATRQRLSSAHPLTAMNMSVVSSAMLVDNTVMTRARLMQELVKSPTSAMLAQQTAQQKTTLIDPLQFAVVASISAVL